MNIYILPENEEKLRSQDNMSGLINDLLKLHFGNQNRVVNSPADFVITEITSIDEPTIWTLNFNRYNSIDDIVVSSGLAQELLKMKAEHKAKELKPCTAVEHTITDDGKHCRCGYFTRLHEVFEEQRMNEIVSKF